MNLEEYVAVSGLSGVYKMVANRSNGLIIADLNTGKRKFAPARKHQFTPLASIGIYTDDDTEELKVVFRSMLEKIETLPPVATNASGDEMYEYFSQVLPSFDRDRVHVSDIKKVIKWFNYLHERNLLSLDAETENAKSEEE